MTLESMTNDIIKKCLEVRPFDLGENSTCTMCYRRLCICLCRRRVECESNQCDAFFTEPIRLSDVMLAIHKVDPSGYISIDGSGTFGLDDNCFDEFLEYKFPHPHPVWNFEDDNIENQSDAVKKFIFNLLQNMKVKDLIKELQKLDPERIVVMSSDAEGNSHSPLYSISEGAYREESTYSGDYGLEKLTDEDIKDGYSKEDVVYGEKAICLHPTN